MPTESGDDLPTEPPRDLRATPLEVDGERLVVLSYATGRGAPRRDDLLSLLTSAEREVASLLLEGWPSAQIAAHRGSSRATVHKQIENAYRKLGVSSRAELAARLSRR